MPVAAPFRVFVGWDSNEDIAYRICKRSIEPRASVPVAVVPVKQAELRARSV